jgi:putative FmdB family regulatory protein
MPTYDYQCQKCEFEFEREQRITEDPIKLCPKCKSRQAKRLLSASNFILKGGGWYADGYGSAGAKKSASGSDSEDSSPSTPKSDSTTTTTTTTTTSKEKAAPSSSSSDKKGGGKGGSDKAGKSTAE